MTRTQIVRVLIRVCVGASVVSALACASSPNRPSTAPPDSLGSSWAAVTYGVTTASLAQCFGGSRDASCFSGARLHTASATGAALTSAPVFNNNQPVLNSGPTVTLSWTAPTSGTAVSYIVEASSTPGGLANLANFNTGNAQTTLVVPDVPAGTYYVRIRGFDSGGAGPPSNEVQLIVISATGGSCDGGPGFETVISLHG